MGLQYEGSVCRINDQVNRLCLCCADADGGVHAQLNIGHATSMPPWTISSFLQDCLFRCSASNQLRETMYCTTCEPPPCYYPSSTGAATSIIWTSRRNWHSLVLCRAGGQPSKIQPPLHINEEERREIKVTRRHVISMPGSMLMSSAALSFSGRVGPNGDLRPLLLTVYNPSEVCTLQSFVQAWE